MESRASWLMLREINGSKWGALACRMSARHSDRIVQIINGQEKHVGMNALTGQCVAQPMGGFVGCLFV